MAQHKEILLTEKVWIPAVKEFTFREQVDPHSGKKSFILKGMMLPFGKISRNNVLYNKESVISKHKELIGRPLMYNHKIEDGSLPRGHFVDSYIREDGWYYEADVDPAERDLIRKLERGDIRHVSIQLIGGRVVERLTEEGRSFAEAYVSDIIEGSVVPAPGFLDTTASFAEAFMEDVTTTTGKGAIAPAKLADYDEDEDEEKLAKELIKILGKEKVEELLALFLNSENK